MDLSTGWVSNFWPDAFTFDQLPIAATTTSVGVLWLSSIRHDEERTSKAKGRWARPSLSSRAKYRDDPQKKPRTGREKVRGGAAHTRHTRFMQRTGTRADHTITPKTTYEEQKGQQKRQDGQEAEDKRKMHILSSMLLESPVLTHSFQAEAVTQKEVRNPPPHAHPPQKRQHNKATPATRR